MIYTSYEMIQDCRAGRPAGLSFFVSNYVPVIRKIVAHYAAGTDGLVEKVLRTAPESELFRAAEPAPERWFLARLRQYVVGLVERAAPEVEVDLETVAKAFEPLTVVEKQATWMETMGYSPEPSAAMLRMAPGTVQKIRVRAAELLRGSVDSWRQTMLLENGAALGRAAAGASTKDCLSPKAFLDVLDGRNTWRDREDLERHVTGCWHCVDHFCRMAEVIELVRGIQPLSDAEAEPYRRLLGVRTAKAAGWKRLFGG
jgi:hypothetical protein